MIWHIVFRGSIPLLGTSSPSSPGRAKIQNRKEVKFASILISVFQLSAICERGLLFGLGTLLDSRYKAMPRPEAGWQPGKTGYMLGFRA